MHNSEAHTEHLTCFKQMAYISPAVAFANRAITFTVYRRIISCIFCIVYIYDTFFPGMAKEQAEITERLNRFEQEMSFDFIPGVLDFIADLHRNGVKTAVVTSSNEAKMAAVYRVHPEIKTLFDRILTAEMFTASKPAPDCFLLGMEVFGTTPDTTYVFEDSFNGLKAGMASGATVIGLATTNSREDIAPLCHYVLDDFQGFTYDKLTQLYK